LRDHFGAYGEIESINVKTDPNTGRSRGFAFIVYGSADSIDKVVAAGDHIINNKKVDPKKAKARHGKIFVGGLTTEISDDEIKTYFGQFGNVSVWKDKAVNLLSTLKPDEFTVLLLIKSMKISNLLPKQTY
jgi:squid